MRYLLFRSSIYISYVGRLAGAKTRCINNGKDHPSVKMETLENFLLYYIRSTVLTMDVPSTVNAQAATGLWWPLNWWIILPTAMSHSPTVSSQLQEANRAPLPGENCTFVTPYLWPTSFWAAAYTEIILLKVPLSKYLTISLAVIDFADKPCWPWSKFEIHSFTRSNQCHTQSLDI